MDWQILAVVVAVVAALFYVARGWWRSWRPGKTGCGGGCGCAQKQETPSAQKANLISVDQLTARLRQRQ